MLWFCRTILVKWQELIRNKAKNLYWWLKLMSFVSAVPIEHYYSAIVGSLPNNHRTRCHVGPSGNQEWRVKWRDLLQWGCNLSLSTTSKGVLFFLSCFFFYYMELKLLHRTNDCFGYQKWGRTGSRKQGTGSRKSTGAGRREGGKGDSQGGGTGRIIRPSNNYSPRLIRVFATRSKPKQLPHICCDG